MRAFTTVVGTPVLLPADNVDTDQIIPASFLKIVDREGLAQGLFHGWRFRDDGSPDPGFALNHPRSAGAEILLVGENFGCGSSREHAPWALQAWGFRVVLGMGFADIFKGNAHRNGLLTVPLEREHHRALVAAIQADENASVSVDLRRKKVTLSPWGDQGGKTRPDGPAVDFEVDAFSRHCMLNGTDPFGHLLEHLPAVAAFEHERRAGGDAR